MLGVLQILQLQAKSNTSGNVVNFGVHYCAHFINHRLHQRFVPMQPTTVYTRDRCVTGIHGLDEILRGGIPYGSTVLAAGTCGSGKTTLGMEFLVRGALAGEACAHFTSASTLFLI
jgi:predicted ATP-dependent serine protease